LPEHCVFPGLHTPEQAPPVQTYMHDVGVPYEPFDPHVAMPVAPMHSVVSGTQLPVQAPLTHADFEQATGAPHSIPLQVCTPLPEHSVAPLVQLPVHAPAAHVPVEQA
jgi:hypothetical protein